MGKIDLTRALRINTQTGELRGLKGAGFAWVKPAPSGAFTPATLFARGEKGTWTTPSGFFADTEGTQPAALGEGVARVSDLGESGWHALQPDPSRRPLLGRAPKGGRRNLFTRTEEFNTGSWTRFDIASLAQDGPTSPFGAPSWTLVSSGGTARLRQFRDHLPNTDYVMSWVAKKGTASILEFGNQGRARFHSVTFDLDAGAVISNGSGDWNPQASIQDLGDGWFCCAVRYTTTEGFNPASSEAGLRWSTAAGDSVYLASAQLELGSEPTPYQRVSSPLDVTENGATSPAFLHFDLSDDALEAEASNGWFDVIMFGRAKTWLQRNVRIPSGGTLAIGPTTITGGADNLLSSLGGIVGWLAIDRSLTDPEIDDLQGYYNAFGAAAVMGVSQTEPAPEPEPEPKEPDSSDAVWTLEDATYLGQSPALSGSDMRTVEFSANGLRAYAVFRSTEVVRQYDLSEPFDIQSAAPAGNGAHDFSGYIATGVRGDSVAHGFFIRKDTGTTAWLWNRTEIWELTLSTAWDITTATQTGYLYLGATMSRGHDIDWKADGTRWFVEDRNNDRVYQWDCAIPWDVETSTLAGSYAIPNGDGVRGIELDPTGSRMFLMHTTAQEAREYHLSTLWDVTTASVVRAVDVSGQSGNPRSIVFRPDGTQFFVGDASSRRVHLYGPPALDGRTYQTTDGETFQTSDNKLFTVEK